MVRSGLEQLLSTAADIELVGTAGNGGEAVEVVGRERPDVVLMDLSMPEIDGVEASAASSRPIQTARGRAHVIRR